MSTEKVSDQSAGTTTQPPGRTVETPKDPPLKPPGRTVETPKDPPPSPIGEPVKTPKDPPLNVPQGDEA